MTQFFVLLSSTEECCCFVPRVTCDSSAAAVSSVRNTPLQQLSWRGGAQLSASEESVTSIRRVCFLRTFQWRHSARLSNQSYTRSWQQMEGTG
uniref:Uncharacterized protein n=1 Tax=Anguilla anguilla TaxID=7936 RepID=A0A0E9PKR0_ANGAN